MKSFRLLIISLIVIGTISCDKESLPMSSGKGIINGENYTYKTTLLSQITGPYPHEARLYNEDGKFIFQTLQMPFTPTNKKSNSPNFIIEFAISDTQDLIIGKKYYTSGCYLHQYRWEDGVSYDELRRNATGNVELTSIDKENGWVEARFEFEVPATDEYEKWSAKGSLKLNTDVI